MAIIKKKVVKKNEETTPKKKDSLGRRLKRFYRNNRIYCILMFISLACILLVVTALVLYFLAQTNSSSYGNRLDDISKYDVKKDIKAVEEYKSGVEKITDFSIRVQGKIIYLDIHVAPETTLEEMQNIATGTLDKFKPENLAYYDLQFAMYREGYKTYYGSKSSTNSTITWSRYNLDAEKIENEEKPNE